MSIRQILKARKILCMVPDARRRQRFTPAWKAPWDPMPLPPRFETTRMWRSFSISILRTAAAHRMGFGLGRGIRNDGAGTRLFRPSGDGFAGVDFKTGDPARRCPRTADALLSTGVTRFLPTLITSSFEDFVQCAGTVLNAGHPSIAGLHMEGPYISPVDGPRGAHRRAHVIPALLGDFLRRQEAARGRIVLVTLARKHPARSG
jgi:hypothetical protein